MILIRRVILFAANPDRYGFSAICGFLFDAYVCGIRVVLLLISYNTQGKTESIGLRSKKSRPDYFVGRELPCQFGICSCYVDALCGTLRQRIDEVAAPRNTGRS